MCKVICLDASPLFMTILIYSMVNFLPYCCMVCVSLCIQQWSTNVLHVFVSSTTQYYVLRVFVSSTIEYYVLRVFMSSTMEYLFSVCLCVFNNGVLIFCVFVYSTMEYLFSVCFVYLTMKYLFSVCFVYSTMEYLFSQRTRLVCFVPVIYFPCVSFTSPKRNFVLL